MVSSVICLVLLQGLYSDTSASWNKKIEQTLDARMEACIEVIEDAQEEGVCPLLASSVAWHESKFNKDAVSSVGARGVLQVLPKYWCPDKKWRGCDLTREGIKALKVYLNKYESEKEALCHYNSGNKCNKKSRYYAKKVLVTKNRLDYVWWWVRSMIFD